MLGPTEADDDDDDDDDDDSGGGGDDDDVDENADGKNRDECAAVAVGRIENVVSRKGTVMVMTRGWRRWRRMLLILC